MGNYQTPPTVAIDVVYWDEATVDYPLPDSPWGAVTVTKIYITGPLIGNYTYHIWDTLGETGPEDDPLMVHTGSATWEIDMDAGGANRDMVVVNQRLNCNGDLRDGSMHVSVRLEDLGAVPPRVMDYHFSIPNPNADDFPGSPDIIRYPVINGEEKKPGILIPVPVTSPKGTQPRGEDLEEPTGPEGPSGGPEEIEEEEPFRPRGMLPEAFSPPDPDTHNVPKTEEEWTDPWFDWGLGTDWCGDPIVPFPYKVGPNRERWIKDPDPSLPETWDPNNPTNYWSPQGWSRQHFTPGGGSTIQWEDEPDEWYFDPTPCPETGRYGWPHVDDLDPEEDRPALPPLVPGRHPDSPGRRTPWEGRGPDPRRPQFYQPWPTFDDGSQWIPPDLRGADPPPLVPGAKFPGWEPGAVGGPASVDPWDAIPGGLDWLPPGQRNPRAGIPLRIPVPGPPLDRFGKPVGGRAGARAELGRLPYLKRFRDWLKRNGGIRPIQQARDELDISVDESWWGLHASGSGLPFISIERIDIDPGVQTDNVTIHIEKYNAHHWHYIIDQGPEVMVKAYDEGGQLCSDQENVHDSDIDEDMPDPDSPGFQRWRRELVEELKKKGEWNEELDEERREKGWNDTLDQWELNDWLDFGIDTWPEEEWPEWARGKDAPEVAGAGGSVFIEQTPESERRIEADRKECDDNLADERDAERDAAAEKWRGYPSHTPGPFELRSMGIHPTPDFERRWEERWGPARTHPREQELRRRVQKFSCKQEEWRPARRKLFSTVCSEPGTCDGTSWSVKLTVLTGGMHTVTVIAVDANHQPLAAAQMRFSLPKDEAPGEAAGGRGLYTSTVATDECCTPTTNWWYESSRKNWTTGNVEYINYDTSEDWRAAALEDAIARGEYPFGGPVDGDPVPGDEDYDPPGAIWRFHGDPEGHKLWMKRVAKKIEELKKGPGADGRLGFNKKSPERQREIAEFRVREDIEEEEAKRERGGGDPGHDPHAGQEPLEWWEEEKEFRRQFPPGFKFRIKGKEVTWEEYREWLRENHGWHGIKFEPQNGLLVTAAISPPQNGTVVKYNGNCYRLTDVGWLYSGDNLRLSPNSTSASGWEECKCCPDTVTITTPTGGLAIIKGGTTTVCTTDSTGLVVNEVVEGTYTSRGTTAGTCTTTVGGVIQIKGGGTCSTGGTVKTVNGEVIVKDNKSNVRTWGGKQDENKIVGGTTIVTGGTVGTFLGKTTITGGDVTTCVGGTLYNDWGKVRVADAGAKTT